MLTDEKHEFLRQSEISVVYSQNSQICTSELCIYAKLCA